MQKISAYKIRLKPTSDQIQTLIGWQGQLRFIWNMMLEINIRKYDTEKKFEFRYDMQKRLPALKKAHRWLNAPAHAYQNTVKRLHNALIGCFKQGLGFPNYKAKHFDNPGIEIPQSGKHIKWWADNIQIPIIGKIKWTYHRKIKGRLLSATIKRDGDQWYVCMLTEQESVEQQTNFVESDCIGIDLGLKDFAITSDGEVIETPKFYRKKQKKLKRAQQKLSRKEKASRNREKQKKKVVKIHQKIRFQRSNFHHQLSSAITKRYPVVFVENLNIKGMIKNRKLAKSIADQGWAQFITYLKYKQRWAGNVLHQIDRGAPSTKACHMCGSKKPITLGERTYVCGNCELVMDRDANAAINILQFGIRETNTAGTAEIYACGAISDGDPAIAGSSYVAQKQESIPSSEGSCCSLEQQ